MPHRHPDLLPTDALGEAVIETKTAPIPYVSEQTLFQAIMVPYYWNCPVLRDKGYSSAADDVQNAATQSEPYELHKSQFGAFDIIDLALLHLRRDVPRTVMADLEQIGK